MQVKFTINEGYNHDSIVRSLIAKKLKGKVNRNEKKQIRTNDVRKSNSQQEILIKYNFMLTVTIRQSIVPSSSLEIVQMVQTSCNNSGNMQIVYLVYNPHVL